MMTRSVTSAEVDGIRLPGFPPTDVQDGTVALHGVAAIDAADRFYIDVRRQASWLGIPLGRYTRLLDFGCGWGRIIRFFVRDVPDQQLYGADVSPTLIDSCVQTGVPGNFSVIDPVGHLPYPDAFFTHLLAYSVFTHLSPAAALNRLEELARVAVPGALFFFTVRPPQFLEFVAQRAEVNAKTSNERALFALAEEARAHVQRLGETGYAYLATIPGTKDTYGDAVYTEQFIRHKWAERFSLVSYQYDLSRGWQALVVMRRP
jgi:SAM-dependent methyltransferase